MEKFLMWLEYIEDTRQERKIKHLLKDIIVIVLFATLANADDWVEMAMFAEEHQEYLRKYIKLENGIPSHDTLCRVMGMINPEVMQQIYGKWQEMLNQKEGETIKKIIAIDGKTMCGNQQNDIRPSHIVSAWSKEDGFCLGQKAVDEKSNEITAIPELLNKIQIKGQIVTIDAMGTQREIAAKIRERRADYVLALKKNQGTLYREVKEYFRDESIRKTIEASRNYQISREKAHGQREIREYYQTDDIKWLTNRKLWKGIKSIGMERKTIYKGDEKREEYRYFISSLPLNIGDFGRAVRGHWSVEIMHWHLDVTFREDTNLTVDKTAAQNQNIIRKWCLGILKMAELSTKNNRLSIKKKRFAISLAPVRFLEEVLNY